MSDERLGANQRCISLLRRAERPPAARPLRKREFPVDIDRARSVKDAIESLGVPGHRGRSHPGGRRFGRLRSRASRWRTGRGLSAVRALGHHAGYAAAGAAATRSALRGRHASCKARTASPHGRLQLPLGQRLAGRAHRHFGDRRAVARFSRATVEFCGVVWWSGGTSCETWSRNISSREVVRALQLETMLRPFTRCRECNVLLEVVSREAVDAMLPERVRIVVRTIPALPRMQARVLGGHALQAAETCPRSTHRTRDALGAVRAIARTASRAECLSTGRRRTPDWAEDERRR